MAIRYDETPLWKRTLGANSDDVRISSGLGLLRSTFETAHERIQPIVRQAHHDCRGLTIHDESHLDALWQMADLIAGSDYPLNPLEAFIFGCSILFHDSALAISAYAGGLDELKTSPEWTKAESQFLAPKRSLRVPGKKALDPKFEKALIFQVLRELHANQASKMPEMRWKKNDSDDDIYIIEDTELRDYYGQVIGRIAQSHHWDIERVSREFSTKRAPPPNLPAEWHLNELKVACLLRCADAAHIDKRRAPLMEYALISPQGISALHWNFQHRLGTPSCGDHSIVYNSGRDFGRSEAEAWWLCYDTCRMISGELQTSNAVLKEAEVETFYANRVEGTERPKLFSRFVRCDGWEPVDAEVRVSDPISLAQTLVD